MFWFALALLLALNQDTKPALASMAGRVVNASGEGLRKAEVSLSGLGVELTGVTDADGSFLFKDLKPGMYQVTAHKSGYLDGEPKPTSRLSVQAGDEMKNIVIQLTPEAAIGGRVFDQDGDPVAGANVRLMAREKMSGRAKMGTLNQTATNRNGQFQFEGLSAGRYFISVAPDDDRAGAEAGKLVDSRGEAIAVRDAPTYYPSALFMNGAAPIDVEDGQDLAGMDVHLRRGKMYRLSGKVDGPLNGGATVSIFSLQGGPSFRVPVTSTGDFTYAGLLSGSYELALGSGDTTIGRTTVDISDGDREGVVIRPFVPARVKIRFAIEGRSQEKIPFMTASLRKDPLEDAAFCEVHDGECTVRSLEPGRYSLSLPGKGQYVKSVRLGSTEMSPRAIDVHEGDVGLEVLVGQATGEIQGEVLAEGTNQDWKSVEVALMRVLDKDEIFELPIITHLDQYGHFALRNLPPAKYRIYAGREFSMEKWTDPEFVQELSAKCTDLDVPEKQTVHLQVKQISSTPK